MVAYTEHEQRIERCRELTACSPGFSRLLSGYDTASLEKSPSAVIGLWPDLTIGYLNSGWYRFARENDGEQAVQGWELGAYLPAAISDPLQTWYTSRFEECLRGDQPWEHDFECSSAEHFRVFRLCCYPLRSGEGLLLVYSKRIEHAHDAAARPVAEPELRRYVDARGIVRQCMHCRRVARGGDDHTWDWVPDWVQKSPQETSHGICPICFAYYFGEGGRMLGDHS